MKVLANFIGNMAKISAKFTIFENLINNRRIFWIEFVNNNYFKPIENMYADCLKTENS